MILTLIFTYYNATTNVTNMSEMRRIEKEKPRRLDKGVNNQVVSTSTYNYRLRIGSQQILDASDLKKCLCSRMRWKRLIHLQFISSCSLNCAIVGGTAMSGRASDCGIRCSGTVQPNPYTILATEPSIGPAVCLECEAMNIHASPCAT